MWTDFFICLFTGFLGIHKFREHKIKTGILYLCTLGLFFIGWIYDSIHYLIIAIKGKKTEDTQPPLATLSNETLPIVMDNSIILQSGEQCHYSSQATRIIPKEKTVGYSGGNTGVSFRIAKGVTIHSGSSRGTAIKKNVLEEHQGKFYITNKRIIFTSIKGGFDKKIANITSVIPADDGIVFQFGSQIFIISIPNNNKAYQIVSHIINN